MNQYSIDALNALEEIRTNANAEYTDSGFKKNRTPISLNGFTVSVQASQFHYCRPREDTVGSNFYTHVELGFPNPMTDEDIELIGDYAEDPTDYTDTVYGYVPVELVRQLIMSWAMD